MEAWELFGEYTEDCGYCGHDNTYRTVGLRTRGAVPARVMQRLALSGWFRSNTWVFVSAASSCCPLWCLRVIVPLRFPNKLQRQAEKRARAAGIVARLERGEFSDEKYALYRRYELDVHNSVATKESFVQNFCASETHSFIMHMMFRSREGELIGCSVLDVFDTCVISSYFFWDKKANGKLSLGTYSADVEMQFAEDTKRLFWFPDGYVSNCSKMNYKDRFEPAEVFCSSLRWHLFRRGQVGCCEAPQPPSVADVDVLCEMSEQPGVWVPYNDCEGFLPVAAKDVALIAARVPNDALEQLSFANSFSGGTFRFRTQSKGPLLITLFPKDVLVLIFRQLGDADLVSLCCTCSSLNSFVLRFVRSPLASDYAGLRHAVENGHVDFFLKWHAVSVPGIAPLDLKRNESEFLRLAVFRGQHEIVRVLLDLGCDPSADDFSCISIAASAEDAPMMHLLLSTRALQSNHERVTQDLEKQALMCSKFADQVFSDGAKGILWSSEQHALILQWKKDKRETERRKIIDQQKGRNMKWLGYDNGWAFE